MKLLICLEVQKNRKTNGYYLAHELSQKITTEIVYGQIKNLTKLRFFSYVLHKLRISFFFEFYNIRIILKTLIFDPDIVLIIKGNYVWPWTLLILKSLKKEVICFADRGKDMSVGIFPGIRMNAMKSDDTVSCLVNYNLKDKNGKKRKAELIWSNKTGKFNRKVLRFYSIGLLLKFENIVTSSSFIFYTLWASGPILNGAPTEWMLLTVPFVLLGIFRYQQISEPIENNSQQSFIVRTENPEEILLKDNFIKIIIIFWISTTFIIGYFFA